MRHIYETPVETVVDLIARILSVCVNIQKYARYICARTQRTLCVTSRITMKSQAASSTALVNYSTIFPPTCKQKMCSIYILTMIRKRNWKCFSSQKNSLSFVLPLQLL